jgi:zona occludens toxin (predicted ATPase)
MRKLQLLCVSVVLTLLLSISAFADDGIILTGKNDPPPPPASTNAQSAAVDTGGIIETGVTSSDPVTNAALALVQSVLILF